MQWKKKTERKPNVALKALRLIAQSLADVTGMSSNMLTFVTVRTQDAISPHAFSLLPGRIGREDEETHQVSTSIWRIAKQNL